jgi:cyclic pyranopterin phosphate synthase
MAQSLVDSYGRRIRKLRVSLTDHCNLRCLYCMPVEAQFLELDSYLSADEYVEIIRELMPLGLEEVRLTGGEPLLRREFVAIVHQIASLGLSKIGLTTNGLFLEHYLDFLLKVNVVNLNISLDSLQSHTFERITRGKCLAKVLANIDLAKIKGFKIKINVVTMKGLNENEILDFVEYSKYLQVEVRFLELMRIGYACHQQSERFISAQTVLNKIREKYILSPLASALDSTSFGFQTSCGARLGFIASESQPFCGHCSRWRLSVDGILRACLLKNEGLSVRHLSPEQRRVVYQTLLGMKPYLRPPEVQHAMYQIGG